MRVVKGLPGNMCDTMDMYERATAHPRTTLTTPHGSLPCSSSSYLSTGNGAPANLFYLITPAPRCHGGRHYQLSPHNMPMLDHDARFAASKTMPTTMATPQPSATLTRGLLSSAAISSATSSTQNHSLLTPHQLPWPLLLMTSVSMQHAPANPPRSAICTDYPRRSWCRQVFLLTPEQQPATLLRQVLPPAYSPRTSS